MTAEHTPKSADVLRHSYGDGEWQFGDLRLPPGEGPFPVALIIHGGFWKAQYGLDLMDNMADDFTARGLATWNIEYSRVGHVGGGWPGTLLDVGAAADHLCTLAASYPLDLTRVVTIGHSAGGHLALWLAGRHRLPQNSVLAVPEPLPLAGVISLAGANDLHLMWEVRQENSPVVNFLGGTPSECPALYEQASPRALLPLGVQQVLIHGTEDEVVPPVLSRSYYREATAAGDEVQLVELPQTEHFRVIDPDSTVWPVIAREMLRLSRLS